MKRALFLMLTLFIMVFSFNVTASGNVDAALDVTTLTTEELLNLKEIIDARLIDLGIYPFIALERGDRGEEVERLQGRLMELFYLDGLATARFDSQTQLALKQFERANQLTPDGLASIEDQNSCSLQMPLQKKPKHRKRLKTLQAFLPQQRQIPSGLNIKPLIMKNMQDFRMSI